MCAKNATSGVHVDEATLTRLGFVVHGRSLVAYLYPGPDTSLTFYENNIESESVQRILNIKSLIFKSNSSMVPTNCTDIHIWDMSFGPCLHTIHNDIEHTERDPSWLFHGLSPTLSIPRGVQENLCLQGGRPKLNLGSKVNWWIGSIWRMYPTQHIEGATITEGKHKPKRIVNVDLIMQVFCVLWVTCFGFLLSSSPCTQCF